MSETVLLDLDAYEEQTYIIPAKKYFGVDLKINDISCERWMELEKLEKMPAAKDASIMEPIILVCDFLLKKDNPNIKREDFLKMNLGQLKSLKESLVSLAQKSFLGKGPGTSPAKAPQTTKESD